MEMPVDLVTPESVAARFYRALTPDETRVLPAWIEDAWYALVYKKDLGLTGRLSAVPPEADLLDRVARTMRSALLRKLRNPQGVRQYSQTVDDATVSETLASETLAGAWYTDDELDDLAPADMASDAFSIRLDAHLPDEPYVSGWW